MKDSCISVRRSERMILKLSISFSVVLMILTEGSSVKVHPGGNTTLPCSIKDDQEMTWIIITGNQTLVRIMRLEYGYGPESKPEPINIHPSYLGRIRALNSSRNTHSLLLMNITDSDLIIYCCADYRHEQSHCTKLDYEDVSTEDVDQQDPVSHDLTVFSVSIVCVLLLSGVCVFITVTGLKRGLKITNVPSHQDWIVNSVQGEKGDWTLAEVLYTPIQSNTS